MNKVIFREKNQTVTEHVYGLDVFRSIAILFVLIGHSFEHSKISPLIQTFGHLGILGVELFFVLSGFLIGSIIMRLIDGGRFHSFSDISTFWKRRWLRTLPLYFLTLLAFLRFDYHGRHALFDYPYYFFFLQNFSSPIPEFFELSWSLAIEEHFYFWFPITFVLWVRMTKNTHWSVVLTALTFILVAYLFRLSWPLISDWNIYNRTIRLTVLSRIDAIMFGVLMAAIQHYWKTGFDWIRRATPVTATLFLLLCSWWFVDAPNLMESRPMQVNLFTVQAIVCALLLPWFYAMRSTGSRTDFFTVTSRLSYSLYLVHILVIIAVNRILGKLGLYERVYDNPFLLYPIYFGLFYFVSWFSFHRVEKPFLKLRDETLSLKSIAKASWVSILASVVLICFY